MNIQGRETALETLRARRQEARRTLTALEQQILRTRLQVRIIQQQIAGLSKGRRRAA